MISRRATDQRTGIIERGAAVVAPDQSGGRRRPCVARRSRNKYELLVHRSAAASNRRLWRRRGPAPMHVHVGDGDRRRDKAEGRSATCEGKSAAGTWLGRSN